MAKLLFYIRTFPVTFILVVAAFTGTLWLLWPLPGALWLAAIMGLSMFIFCLFVGMAVGLLFEAIEAIEDIVSFDSFN